jgi:hypothetical protein
MMLYGGCELFETSGVYGDADHASGQAKKWLVERVHANQISQIRGER